MIRHLRRVAARVRGTYGVTHRRRVSRNQRLRHGLQNELLETRQVLSTVAAGTFSALESADLLGRAGDQLITAVSTGESFERREAGTWSNEVKWDDFQSGDFNGDGWDDVVARAPNGAWWVGITTDQGIVNENWGSWSSDVTWDDVRVADVNGDGLSDIAGRANGTWHVAKSTGTSFENEDWGSWSTRVEWRNVMAADLNGDGLTDIVGRLQQNGSWWGAISDGSQFSNVNFGKWSTKLTWRDIQVADVNGDGMDDVIGRAAGNWWAGLSDGSRLDNAKWGPWSEKADWENLEVADVDGDGRDDVVGRVNGNWWVAHSTGASFENEKWGYWSTNVTWTAVVVADFNGDGRDDIAGRANDQWTVSRSVDGSFVNEVWGAWPDEWTSIEPGAFAAATTPVPRALLSIAATDATKVEGDSGSTLFSFTVTRSGDASQDVTVNYAVNGTGGSPATAADFDGGTLPSGTVSLPAGVTSKALLINVAGDLQVEADETFDVTLSNPSGTAQLGTATAAGSILNDDLSQPPVLSIAAVDAVHQEGDIGSTAFTFTLTRTGDTTQPVTVDYSVTGSGSFPANASDFGGGELPSGTVSLAAGQTSNSLVIDVAGDQEVEADEAFWVTLSNPSGTALLATATAQGTILNDDNDSDNTTPLAQPSWLDGDTETYQYPKLGLSYDRTTYFTNFDETNVLIAHDSAELAAHVAAAKADNTINAIYLDPAAGEFTYPRNLLRNLNRPVDSPLVIRTLPGAATQASFSVAAEDYFFSGVAFVDLDFSNMLQLHTGAQDILIERCVGYFDLQGKRVNGTPGTPITNLQFRLNLVLDHWTMSASAMVHGVFVWNIDGFLFEGNLLDHNGWNPNGTRATPPDQGGPTTHNHNIYISRPDSGVVARFNYVSRGSSHGIHFRAGGHMHHNLFVRNPISWQYGYGGDGDFGKYGLTGPGTVEKNLTLDSDEINTSTGNYRGINGWITNAVGVTIDDNVAIDNSTTPVNDAFLQLDAAYEIGATVSNNVTVNWNGALRQGSGSAPVNVTQISNNWGATGLTAAAQQLADNLKSDAYINNLRATRARLGIDIEQLKADMAAIRAGIIL